MEDNLKKLFFPEQEAETITSSLWRINLRNNSWLISLPQTFHYLEEPKVMTTVTHVIFGSLSSDL